MLGPDASVYTEVNEVRPRPGINMSALPAGLNQDEMRARIRHERRVELALEGSRYFDLLFDLLH
nr:RagB/SusD family nutrient uptake outer membrane protein [uncultured Pedobacter sp.]